MKGHKVIGFNVPLETVKKFNEVCAKIKAQTGAPKIWVFNKMLDDFIKKTEEKK
jgi:hypothetical protein